MAARDDQFIAPHLLGVEVLRALRNLAAGRRIDSHLANQWIVQLESLPVERFAHGSLLDRMWELRHNFTAYDAAYIALAEATNSDLFTCDEKLRSGHRARIVLYSRRSRRHQTLPAPLLQFS
ncbi:MAG: type II toxin-antitoxin system VapC family toxin [Acidobacteriota bacterium]